MEKYFSRLYNNAPQIKYKDLPKELKAKADEITAERAKSFLMDCLSIAEYEALDKTQIESNINKALKEAIYTVTGTSESGVLVDLYGNYFIEAWEKVTGQKQSRPASNLSLLESYTAKGVKDYIIPNNKAANLLTSKDMYDYEQGISTLKQKKGQGKQVSAYMQLSYEGESMALSGKYTITPYDRIVLNAVCSLWAAGNEIFTPNMIYRVLKADQNAAPSPQQKGAITRSIEKCRVTKLIINFSEEAKKRNWEIDNPTYDDMLLSVKKISCTINGEEVEAYKINSQPFIYEYSQLSKQVISVPIERFYIGDIASDTEQNIIIKDYLTRRIERMKADTKEKRIIRLDTLFSDTDITINQRSEKQRHIKTITAILKKWKTKNIISEFSFEKEGQTIAKIQISL